MLTEIVFFSLPVLGLAAIVGTVVMIMRDGYRALPTRTYIR